MAAGAGYLTYPLLVYRPSLSGDVPVLAGQSGLPDVSFRDIPTGRASVPHQLAIRLAGDTKATTSNATVTDT